MTTQNKNNNLIALSCFAVLAIFAAVLIIPSSREVFKELSSTHPFIMGFIKFGLLATVGELFAFKLNKKFWGTPTKLFSRMIIWGLIGIAITYMMKTFSGGVIYLLGSGIIPGEGSLLLQAFLISATMNLSFGPTFMAFHKCSDRWLEMKAEGTAGGGIKPIVSSIDWGGFVSFTLFKTVPLFWIPAHTVTFMLPAEYQVMVAAALSIALGIILSFRK